MTPLDQYFGYNTGKSALPADAYRISPSQLSRFFDDTSNWYREQLLGEQGFIGSTATELGNVVHASAYMFVETGSVNYPVLNKYINSITNSDIDTAVIHEQYPGMVQALLDSRLIRPSKSAVCEEFVYHEVLPNIFASGSIDLYDPTKAGGTITDYKTMGSLDSARVPTRFPRAYWFQQMLYAYILQKLNRPIQQCQLIYITRNNVGRISDKTGKPMKDYPSEVHVLTEPVTQEAMEIIDGVVKLIANSIHTWNTQPELRYLLAQDYRLKQPDKPRLFINS